MRFFLFSLITAIILFNQGCRPYEIDREIRQIDSLQSVLTEAENTLIVDFDEINTRRDSIDHKLAFLKKHEDLIAKKDMEFHFLMSEYKAIGKNYKKFVETYKTLEFENARHMQRMNDLKEDLIEGNITKEEFSGYYRSEKKIAEDHLEKVKTTIGEVVYIENNYRRTNKKVSRIYREVKNKIE